MYPNFRLVDRETLIKQIEQREKRRKRVLRITVACILIFCVGCIIAPGLAIGLSDSSSSDDTGDSDYTGQTWSENNGDTDTASNYDNTDNTGDNTFNTGDNTDYNTDNTGYNTDNTGYNTDNTGYNTDTTDVYINQKCYTGEISPTYINDMACARGTPNSECSRETKVCTCVSGYFYDGIASCVTGIGLSKKCSQIIYDLDANQACESGASNSECSKKTGVCTCRAGYFGFYDDTSTGKCIKDIGLNDKCVYGDFPSDTACARGTKNSECAFETNVCTCKTGYFFDGIRNCVAGIGLGKKCSQIGNWAQANQACNSGTPHSECSRKTGGCTCRLFYQDNGSGTCVKGTCNTTECRVTAERIMNATDTSVNPCDDMYQFACGNWIGDQANPFGKTAKFDNLENKILFKLKGLLEVPSKPNEVKAIKKAKNFYKACMDEAAIESSNLTLFDKLLTEFGGWPVLNEDWDSFDEIGGTGKLLADAYMKGARPLAVVGVLQIATTDGNANSYIRIAEPTTTMPARDYYLQGRDDPTLEAYENYTVEFARALGADEATARKDMKDMVDLEIDLAKILSDKHTPGESVTLKLPALPYTFDDFPWREFLSDLYSKLNVTLDFSFNLRDLLGDYPDNNDLSLKEYAGLLGEDEDFKVVVQGKQYFEQLGATISKYSTRTIYNYIIWRCIQGWRLYLPERLRNLEFTYQKALTGATQPTPRWSSCTTVTQSIFSEVLGRMYVDVYFDEKFKPDMKNLVETLKTAFSSQINDLNWISSLTREMAVEKLDMMGLDVGYPRILKNDDYLNNRTSQIIVDPTDALENIVTWQTNTTKTALKALTKITQEDRNNWPISPAELNAVNDVHTNTFYFPAALLEPPFFSENMPKYMLYGGIGYIIGHEMTHGFDTNGRRFDSIGAVDDWMDNLSELGFDSGVQCLVNQYDGFQDPTSKMHLDGNYTINENIADCGGIKESYAAYRNWVQENGEEGTIAGLKYTPDQLFFITAAQVWCAKLTPQTARLNILTDTHSLGQFRVTGMMQNSIEFANAFNCARGSYMNPSWDKCTIW